MKSSSDIRITPFSDYTEILTTDATVGIKPASVDFTNCMSNTTAVSALSIDSASQEGITLYHISVDAGIYF